MDRFKQDTAGNIVLYPWSPFAKGYIIPDTVTETQLRCIARKEMVANLVIALVVLLSLLFGMGSGPVLLWLIPFIWYYYQVNRYTSGLLVECVETKKLGFLRSHPILVYVFLGVFVAMALSIFYG